MASDPVGVDFLKSITGCLKLFEIILSFVTFLCAMIFNSSWAWALLAFMKTVSLMSLIYAGAIIIFHVVHCTQGFSQIPWHKLDCVICILMAILFFTSASLLVYYEKPVSLDAAVVFAYASASVYILNTIYKIMYALH